MSTDRSRWRALGGLLRPHALRWVALAVLVAAGSALNLLGPLVIRRIVDSAQRGASASVIAGRAGVYLALAILGQITGLLATWFATTTAWQTTNEIRLRLTRHVLGLDHEFHRTHTPGELISRVDGDVTTVSNFLGQVVPKLANTVFVAAGVLVVLAFLDLRLALGATLYLAITVALLVRGRQRAVSEASDEMSAFARLYGGIEERLTAAEDLRANGAEHHAMWRFMDESADVMETANRRERAFLQLWWRLQGMIGAGAAIALATGAVLVPRGVITIGTALLLYLYVDTIERPLADVIHQMEIVQKANGAMERVVNLLGIRATIVDHGTVQLPSGPPAVEFVDCSFHYGDEQSVLDDVSLTIPAGCTVGIVGRTGSGKTTLSRLVLRLVEPTSGRLLIGGVPIADIPLAELRQHVALIPQEVELFGATVRDNVALFDPAPTDDAVASALRNAGLADLGGDLGRQLSSGGGGLSAGEAQLISLARVWLRDPSLIVLDEATARVDPQTEERLHAAVTDLRRDRTVLIIAHRLSTLRDVDKILVVDAGRVVEFGDRDDLARDPESHYRRLLAVGMEALA